MKKTDVVYITDADFQRALDIVTREFVGKPMTLAAIEHTKQRVKELLQHLIPSHMTLEVGVEREHGGYLRVTTHIRSQEIKGKQFTQIKAENLPFHQAMGALQNGEKIARSIWGGYWHITDVAKFDNTGINSRKAIVAQLKDGEWAIASPYQEDMLANDWMIVE